MFTITPTRVFLLSIIIAFTAFVLHSSDTNLQTRMGSITNYAGQDGSFKRQQSQFRNFIKNDADAEFPAEKDRYHLYVSYACPWGTLSILEAMSWYQLTR